MNSLLENLETEFIKHGDPIIAAGQKAYMRGQFECYGLKATIRRQIQKPYLNIKYLSKEYDIEETIKFLWKKPQREYQYFAQEFAYNSRAPLRKKDIHIYEFMVVNKSWWDTIDYISTKLIGKYFLEFPEERKPTITKWLNSKNIWLQRSAILFQLKYKENLDTSLLTYIITSLLNSNEFFINKAIGWILREYSKTNPQWVLKFIDRTKLNSLSQREALKFSNKQKR